MHPQPASSISPSMQGLNLYDYELPSRVRPIATSPQPDRTARVVDDWPAHPMVSAAELDAFEAHFAGALERMFRAP